MSNHKDIRFFLGSNTKRGFVPLFEHLRDPENGNRFYILKGGPGSGKSSLMRRIATALEAQGHRLEYIPCASDPQSLDAIHDYDAKIVMVDGTAPHTLDPKYPGAYDLIINLGDVWDDNILRENKQDIIELSNMISQCHSMATSCITAAASLLDMNKRLAENYINYEVLETEVTRIAEELVTNSSGKEHKRLLSAVSVGKLVFFEDTMVSLCPKVYVISDDWGAASNAFLHKLRDYALSQSIEFISCYCSIQNPDKIDHLLFPQAGICISTINTFHSINSRYCIPIDHLMNPIEILNISAMTENLSMAQSLIDTAANHIARAKHLHDDLEYYYIKAMDFSQVDNIYSRIMEDINSLMIQKP